MAKRIVYYGRVSVIAQDPHLLCFNTMGPEEMRARSQGSSSFFQSDSEDEEEYDEKYIHDPPSEPPEVYNIDSWQTLQACLVAGDCVRTHRTST